MLKKIYRTIAPNPLDRLLKKATAKKQKKILLAWNRGLGDIALGLYAVVHRIRELIPESEITFLTRENLKDGFKLLEGVSILVDRSWKRGKPYDVHTSLLGLGIAPSSFDLIIEHPDPTYWVKWQLGTLTPKLQWNKEWDSLWKNFDLKKEERYIAVHPHTETSYGMGRNWPAASWQELLFRITEKHGFKVILFGYEPLPLFLGDDLIDLRGKTTLYELLSIIKNCCRSLIVLDSGISSMTYFLDDSFPLQLVSLWGNPRMGILKQNVASPNPQLQHVPILGENEDIKQITAAEVEKILFPK